MKIKFKQKEFVIEAKKLSLIGKIFGLMFKSRETDNLLFEFSNPRMSSIHSFFVFFSFLAVWLDEKNNVTDFYIVKPFTALVSPKVSSPKLVEIPLNSKNAKIIKFFVGKGKV